MDITDKQILAILDRDARTQTSQIAKKLRLSRQVVDYRINQLVKTGVIINFVTLIDPTKFTSNIWHVYIKLQNLTEKIEKDIISYLHQKKEIWWIASCQGEWDLIFSACGNDIFLFDGLISDFRSKFHVYINQMQITSLIEAISFPRGYFLSRSRERQTYISKRTEEKIDNGDLAILRILATNARMPATKIAQKAGLSARQVIYRIKELQRKGVIRMFRLHLNRVVLGYDYYKVCIYTQDYNNQAEHSVLTWCEENPNTLYYIKKISPWTFEIEFETKDYQELNKILKELRNRFEDVIKRTEITLFKEEFKGELDILKSSHK